MSGKKNKKQRETQKPDVSTEQKVNPRVEKLYKRMTKTGSWIVGIAFASILILPEFNNPTLDEITKYLFRIGFTILLLLILVEFIGDEVKQLMQKWIHE